MSGLRDIKIPGIFAIKKQAGVVRETIRGLATGEKGKKLGESIVEATKQSHVYHARPAANLTNALEMAGSRVTADQVSFAELLSQKSFLTIDDAKVDPVLKKMEAAGYLVTIIPDGDTPGRIESIVARKGDSAVVAVRGTVTDPVSGVQNAYDKARNSDSTLQDLPETSMVSQATGKAQAHRGFLGNATSLMNNKLFMEATAGVENITYTGHSAGAAIAAQLAALSPSEPTYIGISSPAGGNVAFAEVVRQKTKGRAIELQVDGDPVPQLLSIGMTEPRSHITRPIIRSHTDKGDTLLVADRINLDPKDRHHLVMAQGFGILSTRERGKDISRALQFHVNHKNTYSWFGDKQKVIAELDVEATKANGNLAPISPQVPVIQTNGTPLPSVLPPLVASGIRSGQSPH